MRSHDVACGLKVCGDFGIIYGTGDKRSCNVSISGNVTDKADRALVNGVKF